MDYDVIQDMARLKLNLLCCVARVFLDLLLC